MWLLARGEVLVHRGNRAIELWTGPRLLDLAGTITGAAEARFVAVGSAEVLGFAKAELEPALVTELLALEAQGLWERIDLDAERDDDTFLPGAIPVPGPWHFRRAQTVAMVVQGEPERVAGWLPRGLRPLPGTQGRYVLVAARFEDVVSQDPRDTRSFRYREVTPFLPAWSVRRGPCAFVPELYPDAWMAVILGREILGFPKRTARIGYRDRGVELLLDGRLALRARWTGARVGPAAEVVGELAQTLIPRARVGQAARLAVEHLPERLGFSAVVPKRIGAAASAGREFAIDARVRVPVALDPIAQAERLDGFEAQLGDGPGVLHGRVLGAWRLESGLRFGPGHRLGSFGMGFGLDWLRGRP